MIGSLFRLLFGARPAQAPARPVEASAAPPAGDAAAPEKRMRKRLSVGRGAHNDIRVDEPSVSRTGLYIVEYDDGTYSLIDTASTGGVWIERAGVYQRVSTPTDAGADDRIRLGNYETTIRALLRDDRDNVDIFVSYAREDAAPAAQLEAALAKHGWKVWRDTRLNLARSFDQEIEAKLRDTRCVIVLWSNQSVNSQWVRAEASVALDRGVLVPVFLEAVDAPVLFRQIQGALFDAQDEAGKADQIKILIEKLEQLIGGTGPNR